MHSSVDQLHSNNNGSVAPVGGGGGGGNDANSPAFETTYNELEDTTGVRQTLIQVRHVLSCPCSPFSAWWWRWGERWGGGSDSGGGGGRGDGFGLLCWCLR